MNNSLVKKLLIYFLIVLVIFALDRFSKLFILNILEDKDKVDIYINSFLSFYLVWNKGVGFGLFSFDDTTAYNLITLIILFINIIIVYLISVEEGLKIYFLLTILGGSLGNFVDRLYYKAVPDFIDINYNGYHWFIFNVADIFITLGIICLILAELLNYKSSNEKK
ncbi:signal peptidase II [Candidatus Pelagibacter sp.]|nr:signal peptidase II [Candidatus Pelagibacter sp.]